jgi:glycosyltransferase involved in cell wall biosynthesis
MATRRVLHLVSGDLWAGAEVMVYSLFHALAGNQDVELMALCLNDGVLARKLSALGCDVHVIPEQRHGFPEIVAAALNRYRRSGIDVLHSHRVKQHLLGAVLSRALGIPSLVATIHGLPEPNRKNDARPVAERAKRLLDRLLIGRAFRTVVVVSRDMHTQLNGAGRNVRGELIQIHNGIRIPEIRLPSPPPSRCVIGSVGRLVPVKDYRLFLATAAAIVRVDSSVQFEILEPARSSVLAWLERQAGGLEEFAFPSRVDRSDHLSTRQYARLVDEWVTGIGLRREDYGTHSLRRTKAALIYKQTGNLRAVQILLGHTKIESTVRYLGVDIEAALALAEGTEV